MAEDGLIDKLFRDVLLSEIARHASDGPSPSDLARAARLRRLAGGGLFRRSLCRPNVPVSSRPSFCATIHRRPDPQA